MRLSLAHHSIVLTKILRILIPALALYTLMVLFKGYAFGDSDHIDLLSYVQYLQQPNLYPHDFFVQDLAQRVPNERTVLALLLAPAGNGLEWVCFAAHLVCTLALLVALFHLAGLFIRGFWARWMALALLFVPFSLFSWGGNDLYYNLLLNSNVAKALGAWAIWWLLNGHIYRFWGAVTVAALFHPVAGGQAALLATVGWWWAMRPPEHRKAMWYGMLAFGAVVVPWAWALLHRYQGSGIPDALVMEMFRFRLPHHFIPDAFGWRNHVVMWGLMGFGLYFFGQKSRFFYAFFAAALLPLLGYWWGVSVWHWSALFATQWCKTTIWLKAFSVMALVAFLEQRWASFLAKINIQRFEKQLFALCLIGTALAWPAMVQNPQGWVGKRAYHFPFSAYRTADPDVDMALKCRAALPPDAVVALPGSMTAFKYFAARSSYVDMKAVVHHREGMAEWYRRVGEVYGLSWANLPQGASPYAVADGLLGQLTEAQCAALQPKGITHLLRDKKIPLALPIVVQNERYALYELGSYTSSSSK